MRDSDRKALRLFRDTIVAQTTPEEAVTFYAQVLKGNARSRKAWALSRALDLDRLDPAVKEFLMSDVILTKEDLAVILATEFVAGTKQSGAWARFWGWCYWPWNWRIK